MADKMYRNSDGLQIQIMDADGAPGFDTQAFLDAFTKAMKGHGQTIKNDFVESKEGMTKEQEEMMRKMKQEAEKNGRG